MTVATDVQPDAVEDTVEEQTEETTEEQDDETPADETPDDEPDENADAFPRSYVVELRKESRGYRDRMKTAESRVDELSRALFIARVAATGKLADPTDLDYNAELLDDTGALAAAVDDLVERKPHLKSRKPFGSVGQGQHGHDDGDVDLMGILRSRV